MRCVDNLLNNIKTIIPLNLSKYSLILARHRVRRYSAWFGRIIVFNIPLFTKTLGGHHFCLKCTHAWSLTELPLYFVRVICVGFSNTTPTSRARSMLHVSRVIFIYPAFTIKLHGKVLFPSLLCGLIALVDWEKRDDRKRLLLSIFDSCYLSFNFLFGVQNCTEHVYSKYVNF